MTNLSWNTKNISWIVFLGLSFSFNSSGSEIRVVTSNTLRQALDPIIPIFEKSSGNKVKIQYSPLAKMSEEVENGAPVDIIIATGEVIDRLIKSHKVDEGTRRGFLILKVGLAVQPGIEKPDIGTPEAFKVALLRSKTIGLNNKLSAETAKRAFERLGISKEILAKVVYPGPTDKSNAGLLCLEKKAEMCIQQINELLETKGIQFVGPLPKDFQEETVLASVRTLSSVGRKEVGEFLNFIRSEALAARARKLGIEPAF